MFAVVLDTVTAASSLYSLLQYNWMACCPLVCSVPTAMMLHTIASEQCHQQRCCLCFRRAGCGSASSFGTVLLTASMLARRTRGRCAEMSPASSCRPDAGRGSGALGIAAGSCMAAAGECCCMLCTPAPLLTMATAARRAMSASRCILWLVR
jgi:hypothetical protein